MNANTRADIKVTMEFDKQQDGAGVDQHVDAIGTNLVHAKELLQDAITHLLKDAVEIRASCAQQQAALKGDDVRQREQLLALNRRIQEGTNSMIMHLQFQDMVTQLLDHVQQSLSVLGVGCSGDERQAGDDQAAKSKPVMSRDMQAGDVELF